MNRTYLSFDSKFRRPVKSGQKTQTIRYNLQEKPSEGELLEAIDDEGNTFGKLEIVDVKDLKISEVPNKDFDGHRNYDSVENVIENLGEYYDDEIAEDDYITVIEFSYIS